MSHARLIDSDPVPVRRARQRDDSFLDQVRCPWCRHPMVARVGNEGPYFHCGCEKKAAAIGCVERSETHRERAVPHQCLSELDLVQA